MIFRAFLLLLCFSSGVLFLRCGGLSALTQRLNLDVEAEQTRNRQRVSDFGLGAVCDQRLEGVADPSSFCGTKVTEGFVVPVWSPPL